MSTPFELQDGETILLQCRRHWMYVVPKLVFAALAGLLPSAIVVVLMTRFGDGFSGVVGLVVGLITLAWFAYWAIRAYFTWFRYQNDLWFVTTQRIIDSTKNNWFHHRIASADLDDVQDIAVERSGLFNTMFNFGDVRCQTAAEQPNFILPGIPNPGSVLELIDKNRDIAKRARFTGR